MRNIVEETYDRLINKWGSKEYKGIGTINCVPPVDYCEIISRIISLMRNKNDNIKILIVTDNWKRRTEIVDSLKNHKNLPCKVMVGGAVLTKAYAEQIGADFYAKDAKASADYAKQIFG